MLTLACCWLLLCEHALRLASAELRHRKVCFPRSKLRQVVLLLEVLFDSAASSLRRRSAAAAAATRMLLWWRRALPAQPARYRVKAPSPCHLCLHQIRAQHAAVVTRRRLVAGGRRICVRSGGGDGGCCWVLTLLARCE
jgi:hypothetical protein